MDVEYRMICRLDLIETRWKPPKFWNEIPNSLLRSLLARPVVAMPSLPFTNDNQ